MDGPSLRSSASAAARVLRCWMKDLAKRTPAGLGGELVAPRERLLDFREHSAEVGEHVRVLGAFAGKQQSERALSEERLLEEVQPRGVADLPALRVGEAVGCSTELGEKIGGGRGDDAEPRAAGGQFRGERRRELGESERRDCARDGR